MVRPCSVSRKPRVHIRVSRHVIISTSHRTRAPILRHEIHTACIGTVLPRREQRRAHHKGNALYYYVDIVCKFNWTDCIASFSLRTPPPEPSPRFQLYNVFLYTRSAAFRLFVFGHVGPRVINYLGRAG